MKTITIAFSIALILGMNIGLVSSDDVPPSHTKGDNMVLANIIGTQYAVKIPLMKAVVTCESSWNETATNYRPKAKHPEISVGLVQLNLLAHKDITKEQAEDPTYALTYLAKGLSTNPNQWSCFSKVKHVRIK